MADFFTAGWRLDPSRPKDSQGQERRQAVEHALARLSHADDLWVLGNAFKATVSVEDIGNILSCTTARCHLLRGEIDPVTPAHLDLWKTVDLASEVVVDGQLVVMSHYPMMSWWGAAGAPLEEQVSGGKSRKISMHVFGEGRGGFRGGGEPFPWIGPRRGAFLSIDQVRRQSEDNLFATPWLEAYYPDRRRYRYCELCSGAIDCGRKDGGYHWDGDRLVTFRGALVLTRISPFPDRGMSGLATATGDICTECLGVALQYFDLQEGVHYRLAPAVTLQVIDRSEVHRVSLEGRA
ncbi:hypothetical protein ACFSHQ_02680 [Gemmobacter lanyuensis]